MHKQKEMVELQQLLADERSYPKWRCLLAAVLTSCQDAAGKAQDVRSGPSSCKADQSESCVFCSRNDSLLRIFAVKALAIQQKQAFCRICPHRA